MSQFQDKGNQKSQVYKVSKEKHYKVGLGMKLFQIKVIKAQSPSIYPYCASKSLAREIGRVIEWKFEWIWELDRRATRQARDVTRQARHATRQRRATHQVPSTVHFFSTGATRQRHATRWVRRATRQHPPFEIDCKFTQGAIKSPICLRVLCCLKGIPLVIIFPIPFSFSWYSM